MILDKIPRIECVLAIPEFVEGELDNLINEFETSKKSFQILKKHKKRIKTFNYFKNILNTMDTTDTADTTNNINKLNFEKEQQIILKIFGESNLELIEKNISESFFNAFVLGMDDNDKMILTKFIISHIDRLINKYIKILVHVEDQIFILSKQNKDNKKIFLKFFFPKIDKNNTNGENIFSDKINSLKDNIHLTLLPTTEGHGLDGLFHLTFRIEGKKSSIFEYSKFASLNIDSNKLGVGIYPDEKCLDALIFKIIQNLLKLVELIKSNDFTGLNTQILNLQNYTNMLDFLTLDILNELVLKKKLDFLYQKYFYSFGKETIKTIIDKLFKIIILTFVELYFGIGS